MATRLVEDMTEKWDPRQYHDTYREDLLARVRAKVKAGRSAVVTQPEVPSPHHARRRWIITPPQTCLTPVVR
jgi:DNA end-binding protein Ku